MDQRTDPRGGGWRRLLPALLLALAAGLAILLAGDRLGLATLRENREALLAFRDAHYAAAAAAYAGLYVAVVALSVPGAVWLTLAGGFLFGTAVAAALTVVSATAGATVLFLAAKSGFGDALHARMLAKGGERLRRLEAALRANETSVLLLMRLVPAVPFFVANLAPAFLGVRVRSFVLTTLVGIVPGTVAFASVGAGLGAVFAAGGEPDLGILLTAPVLVPVLALAALALLPVAIRALRGREAF